MNEQELSDRVAALEGAVKILLGALHDPGRPVLTESQYRELYDRLCADKPSNTSINFNAPDV